MSKIHGGNIFQFAHEQRIEPYEVIDFSANINPLGPSQRGLSALESQLRYISHYPDATNDDILNAIADIYGMNKNSNCSWQWSGRAIICNLSVTWLYGRFCSRTRFF